VYDAIARDVERDAYRPVVRVVPAGP
jgi:hypothetical protein